MNQHRSIRFDFLLSMGVLTFLALVISGAMLYFLFGFDRSATEITPFQYRLFLIALIMEGCLILSGSVFLCRRIFLNPLKNLSDVSQAFLDENWSARCTVERLDELGQVSQALNEMAKKIQDREKKLVLTIESLKKANEEIELAQNEQLQIEKLASIGRLAAGVAHEVGNPLGAVSGYVDILRRSLAKIPNISKEDVELCDRIENETNRISRIIRALLQQARPAKDRIRGVKVKPVLVRSLQLAQVPSSIDVSFDFETEDAEVLAEEDQLVQVFLNLIINARQAMETKKEVGRLKLRCVQRRLPVYKGPGNAEPPDFDTSVVRALKPEIYWVVSVEDNGSGISEEDQKKLFEPFFSTKAPGKGTGLGLYVTKSIIESFRGAIVVRSAVGYGTSFSVFLPQNSDYLAIAT
ncbi:MAG: HAMP domain-containing protein [Deltaproteobacteria bacterium]|nr:HAMP domain-containing protein [Deltaproteobacteria bacterium]